MDKEPKKLSTEAVARRQKFLDEYGKLAKKHHLDFGIYYDFNERTGLQARFTVIEKQDDEPKEK